MWKMDNLRSQAIENVGSCASPATKICLGLVFNDLTEWIFSGYLPLCLQEKPVTVEDVEGLSVKEIVGIAEARERIRSDVMKSTCKEKVNVTIQGQISPSYQTRYTITGACGSK